MNFMPYARKEGPDQSMHSHSLIKAFVSRLKSMGAV